MKKNFILCLALTLSSALFCLAPVKTGDSLKDSALQANRRTALRCLQLASSYLSDKNYEAAISQSSLGIAYDETISDLWYILASAKNSLQSPKAEILPLLEKSFSLNSWVNYNRDNARIMHADILSDTGHSREALSVLDASPSVFSADAEYIRAKACYRLGDAEHISTARNKIDGARRIYPDDTRFPLLFFKYESPAEDNADVVRIKKYFINMITQYVEVSPDKDAELEIYAAWFASGKEREHLLKSFKARGLSHPVYAIVALDSGMLSQKDAFNYVADFADTAIDYEILEEFLQMLDEEETLELAKEYFDSYSGFIQRDTDGDGLSNLYVKYSRGRPQDIFYDESQDGVLDWNVVCDYGNPVGGTFPSRKMKFTWENFPYLKTLSYSASSLPDLSFTFVSEALSWSPVMIKEDTLISSITGSRFFFPQVIDNPDSFDASDLLASASGFDIPGQERENSRIHFTILDGEIVTADYFEGEKKFAQAWFKDNLPDMRVCDKDGDGIYEVSEFYAVDSERKMKVHSLEDIRSVTVNLFGIPSEGRQFYLKMVQIDTDGDTSPDFTEEYIDGQGKIASWDNDSDGKWDVRHVIISGGEELSMFYDVLSDRMITVTSIDGKPAAVGDGISDFSINKDPVYDFYWIENEVSHPKEYYSEAARMALKKLSSVSSSCYCEIMEFKDSRFMAVKTGNIYIGKMIPSLKYEAEGDAASESSESSKVEENLKIENDKNN
ncbi:hypothetical protein [Treponema sp.]|uniref:tetratricopeptide repeat protein n=1 Tax=Treponema sp. TaxID=166 RepID=UPI0025E8E28C|nr:hypothetical protein [Treponema sp.]MCR5219278.1 hypothetical protein [Treponema sp.]